MTHRTPPHYHQQHHAERRPEQSPEQGREQSPDDRDRKDHTDPSSERTRTSPMIRVNSHVKRIPWG